VGADRAMVDRWIRYRQVAGLSLGFLGLFVLDLGFIGSSATDLFYLPPTLQQVAAPPPTAAPPPQILGLNLLPGGNIYLYIIGIMCLVVAMLDLILSNRIAGISAKSSASEPVHLGAYAIGQHGPVYAIVHRLLGS
jgi:hypothetical protein